MNDKNRSISHRQPNSHPVEPTCEIHIKCMVCGYPIKFAVSEYESVGERFKGPKICRRCKNAILYNRIKMENEKTEVRSCPREDSESCNYTKRLALGSVCYCIEKKV
jgi:hypothetical protein